MFVFISFCLVACGEWSELGKALSESSTITGLAIILRSNNFDHNKGSPKHMPVCKFSNWMGRVLQVRFVSYIRSINGMHHGSVIRNT